jgi:hypothetical protein
MGKTKSSPGTWVERDVFESNAFLSLKGFAPQLLILFLAKRQFRNHGRQGKQKKICINCDSLTFTYVEAEKKYGVTKSRLSRAIDELLSKGFIAIVHHGGGFKQDKSVYALSNNWMLWQPGTVFETRKKVGVQRGFCKPNSKVTLENVPIHSHENVPIREVLG